MKNKYFKIIFALAVVLLFVLLTPALLTKPDNSSLKKGSSRNKVKANVKVSASIDLKKITFIAYPEKRIPPTLNWDTYVYFRVKKHNKDKILLKRDLHPTNFLGIGVIDLKSGESIPQGSYDVVLKGYSHLSKLYKNLLFIDQNQVLNLTPYGDLLAGDTHPSGDDFVNSLDISSLISKLETSNYRNDLNQDTKVNSLDLSIQIYNLSKAGEA